MSERLDGIKKNVDKIMGGMCNITELGMIGNISFVLEQIVEYLEDMEKQSQIVKEIK